MPDVWHDEDTVDLRAIIVKLWARRSWLVVSVAACTAMFAVVAFTLEPFYRASTVLVPTSMERGSLRSSLSSALSQVSGLAALAGVNLSSNDLATEEALAVLRSRTFTERFITELNLLPKLFPEQWDAQAGRWNVPSDEAPTLADAYKYFDADIRTVTRDPRTGLVTLQIEWRDPLEAADWANRMVELLNDEMRARAIEQSQASMAFLEEELSATALLGTREAITRLLEAQISQRMLANVTREYAFRVVDRALPPEMDDPARPNTMLLILSGPIIGLLLGALAVLLFEAFRGLPSPAMPSNG